MLCYLFAHDKSLWRIIKNNSKMVRDSWRTVLRILNPCKLAYKLVAWKINYFVCNFPTDLAPQFL